MSLFDTTRFIDVTTNNQANRGIQVFEDSQNPGVTYTSTNSGNVYRTIKTFNRCKNNSTGITTNFTNTTSYLINQRDMSRNTPDGTTIVRIPRLNDRLTRIQTSADRFDRDLTETFISDNVVMVTTPLIQ